MSKTSETHITCHRQARIGLLPLPAKADTIDITTPAKNTNATGSGIGLLTRTISAMAIPAANMIINPTFVPLLKNLISISPFRFVMIIRYLLNLKEEHGLP